MQVKILEDYNPSIDLSANYPSCQHILERVHNNNNGGLAKQNVMMEPLDNMHCC
jgi:hypothetical protein